MKRTSAALIVGVALLSSGCAGPPGRGFPPPAQCPQPRFTDQAPERVRARVNPLAHERAQLAQGRALYEKDAQPPCAFCHGEKGDGQGLLASQFDPPPRNFACVETVRGIPDGQLYWIIRHGSPGTAMPAFANLREEQIWQLVLYLRELAQ